MGRFGSRGVCRGAGGAAGWGASAFRAAPAGDVADGLGAPAWNWSGVLMTVVPSDASLVLPTRASIFIGGHSLGAARAGEYAWSRVMRGLPVDGVYVCGSPRAGNAILSVV